MVIITDINKAIIIIDFIFAPKIIIIIGPRLTLGRLFITVKYGSITLYRNLLYQSSVAIIIPHIVPSEKLINVSYIVIQICLNKLPSLYSDIIVLKTSFGLDDINVLISL